MVSWTSTGQHMGSPQRAQGYVFSFSFEKPIMYIGSLGLAQTLSHGNVSN